MICYLAKVRILFDFSISAVPAGILLKGFQELLGAYVVKPAGKPAIVPDDDPRPAIDSAKDDFKDLSL